MEEERPRRVMRCCPSHRSQSPAVLLAISSLLAGACGRTIEGKRPISILNYEYSLGDGLEARVTAPWDVTSWAGKVYITDREAPRSPGAGRVWEFSARSGRTIATCPQPYGIAAASDGLFVACHNGRDIVRLPYGPGELQHVLQVPATMSPTSLTTDDQRRLYWNNTRDPAHQAIVMFNGQIASFGGWREGTSHLMRTALNSRQLRWYRGRLLAVGQQEGYVYEYDSGEGRRYYIDTTLYNDGPQEVKVVGGRMVVWAPVIEDLAPVSDAQWIITIRSRPAKKRRLYGLLLSSKMEIIGEVWSANDTPDEILGASYGRIIPLGNNLFAMVDFFSSRRVDVFRLVGVRGA